jgi:hypothetical protein
MLLRNKQNRRNRTQFDPSRRPLGTPANATLTHSGAVLTLDFDNPVQLSAATLPITVGALTMLGAQQVSPTRITVTFSAAITAGLAYNIPPRMVAVRTPTGGYIAAQAGTF